MFGFQLEEEGCMDERISFDGRAKLFLIVFSACAFLSIFAAFDTSEHYRAWRTARRWTQEQKETAPALDAERMHAFSLTALGLDTLIIAAAFAGALCLGIAVATDSRHAYATAKLLAGLCMGAGLAFVAVFLWYRGMVGARVLLKGPIFDYDLRIQVPILASLAGYPGLALYFILKAGRR